ncbi:peptidylprolyl isomerase [Sphingomonas oligophenolica]|uniref:peptidylprolyl isomerase n=1 Tax=Sphingomonas oligophenolica TaxID=301154 RepID=A0A502CNU1_9SPHN|nr:peptidylprolyl isomerase [Sphingomonas oligophenolica]TPG14548.1 peptidylprolyl isomerase [Sphingomonas oligophenolica]
MRLALTLLALTLAAPASARGGIVHVRLDTTLGPITLALDARHAPKTVANFMAYVDDRRFDGIDFYRAARRASAPTYGFVQGGIGTDPRRILPPYPLETTAMTGIRHTDGTISMARRSDPNSAGGNFFITIGAIPSMDARPGAPGYAAFGHVVGGMATVKKILAQPIGGRMGGQTILHPIRIVHAVRLDGKAKPTGLVKPWLEKTKK